MDKISFKSFVWPVNPSEFTIRHKKEPIYGYDSAGLKVFKGMGPDKCTVTGSGVFTGPDASAKFFSLKTLYKEGSCGTLHHPHWGDMWGYITELTSTQDARENYLAYTFTFREADRNNAVPQ